MSWQRNLSVSRKLTFAFGIVCGLCILLGFYTFSHSGTSPANPWM
jgi:CHASE3 domain sensor protein